MQPIRLSTEEIQSIINKLTCYPGGPVWSTIDVLVAIDPIDRAFKMKINNGVWSPPMGEVVHDDNNFTCPGAGIKCVCWDLM